MRFTSDLNSDEVHGLFHSRESAMPEERVTEVSHPSCGGRIKTALKGFFSGLILSSGGIDG
jgi:hypothetical protein